MWMIIFEIKENCDQSMHWHHSSVCNVILLHHSWSIWLETEVRNIHSILQSFFTLSDRRRLDYNSDHHSACSGWPHQLIGSIATTQWKNDISVCRGGGTAQCTDIFPLYWCKKIFVWFFKDIVNVHHQPEHHGPHWDGTQVISTYWGPWRWCSGCSWESPLFLKNQK